MPTSWSPTSWLRRDSSRHLAVYDLVVHLHVVVTHRLQDLSSSQLPGGTASWHLFFDGFLHGHIPVTDSLLEVNCHVVPGGHRLLVIRGLRFQWFTCKVAWWPKTSWLVQGLCSSCFLWSSRAYTPPGSWFLNHHKAWRTTEPGTSRRRTFSNESMAQGGYSYL